MKVLAVLVIAVAVVWGWRFHANNVNEHALAAVATQLAGRDVRVECQGFFAELVDISGRAGDVEFPAGRAPDHMFLTRKVCKQLARLRGSSSHGALDCLLSVEWSRWRLETDFHGACADGARPAAEAINTLAHEAMHLRGFTSEAATQCFAIQEDAWTVARLGGTPEQGAAVARFVLAMQGAMPGEYQSSDCRAGGPLDLHPETAAFPTEPVPDVPPTPLRGPALAGF